MKYSLCNSIWFNDTSLQLKVKSHPTNSALLYFLILPQLTLVSTGVAGQPEFLSQTFGNRGPKLSKTTGVQEVPPLT